MSVGNFAILAFVDPIGIVTTLSTVLSYAHSTYHGLCACLWLLGDALATLLNCTDKGNGHDTSTHLQLAPLLEARCLFP